MLKKLLTVLFVCVFVTACETPNTGDNGSAGNGAGGVGSENQGIGGGELAPGVSDTVYFGYDSSALSDDAKAVLTAQANYLKNNSSTNVVVEGHCDERGTREYNIALGERRANATKQFLVGAGVDSSRITTISYGKERPVASGSDEASWALNRRSVTVAR
jgi:peptidoglycan-associated lipoprotein